MLIRLQERDYYLIYRADGTSFRVHESRIIRFSTDKTEMSMLEPAFNSLNVCDNVLWSSGQTMFRMGQGFPVITIDNPTTVQSGSETISEMELLKRQGILKDINTNLKLPHGKINQTGKDPNDSAAKYVNGETTDALKQLGPILEMPIPWENLGLKKGQ